jgi:ribosome-associated protein
VLGVARLLDSHKGEGTVALDIRELGSWTDYHIITTVRSSAHLSGLLRALHDYLKAHAIQPLNNGRRTPPDGWVVLDCGDFLIHLMSGEVREFYSLERLYFRAVVLDHSSKSS